VLMRILPAALLVAALALPAAAPAVVPPRDCGFKTVKGTKYNVKVDGVTCKWGKPRAVTFLKSGSKPSGWTCKRYKNTALKFKCSKGTNKSFFAIKH
jgi:opacity protein-like surface antigen